MILGSQLTWTATSSVAIPPVYAYYSSYHNINVLSGGYSSQETIILIFTCFLLCRQRQLKVGRCTKSGESLIKEREQMGSTSISLVELFMMMLWEVAATLRQGAKAT